MFICRSFHKLDSVRLVLWFKLVIQPRILGEQTHATSAAYPFTNECAFTCVVSGRCVRTCRIKFIARHFGSWRVPFRGSPCLLPWHKRRIRRSYPALSPASRSACCRPVPRSPAVCFDFLGYRSLASRAAIAIQHQIDSTVCVSRLARCS